MFSSFDLRAGYNQMWVHPESRKLTSFTVNDRGNMKKYQFTRIPQGMKNSGAYFQQGMLKIIQDLPLAFVYLDDILIASKKETHIETTRRLFQRLRQFNVKLSPSKCTFARKKVKYLGFVISKEGVEITEDKIKIIKEMPRPRNTKELRRLSGFLNYVRRQVEGYSTIMAPLYDLLKENNKFVWTEKHEEAFITIKRKICEFSMIYFADTSKTFELQIDASKEAVAFIFQQRDDQMIYLRNIVYGGRKLRMHERKLYGSSELEALGLV